MFLKTLPEEVIFEYMMRKEFGLSAALTREGIRHQVRHILINV